MSISINFDREKEVLKRWTHFSGGEKTVVAIAIIMALQRCSPSPFYVFDEIDAALDSKYVRKIAQLILNESVSNNAQYLITTFKEDLLGFPDEHCHYYFVKCNNRRSNIRRVNQ